MQTGAISRRSRWAVAGLVAATTLVPTSVASARPLGAADEWADLADQYVKGDQTYDLELCYPDFPSPVRTVYLTQDGEIIAEENILTMRSSSASSCGASLWTTINSSLLTEGAHTYQVTAAGVSGQGGGGDGDPWKVYIDRTAPGAPAQITATFDTVTNEIDVSWVAATDPPLADGSPGSGVDAYSYRYRRGSGAWSAWAGTQIGSFTLSGGFAGETIEVDVKATDTAGNTGTVLTGSDVAAAANWTPSNYGPESGNSIEHIGFSSDPEPDEPEDDDAPQERSTAPLLDGSNFRVDYEEDNCPGASPCGTYDYKAAAAYARYWWDKKNKDYAFHDNDCTNFVSQALKAGGMKFIRTGGFNDPTPATDDYIDNYKRGLGSWWSARIPGGSSGFSWRWSAAWAQSQKSYERMFDFGVGRNLAHNENIRPGDVVYYRLDPDNPDFTHAAIVSKVTRRHVYVAQHTRPYEDPYADVVKRLNRDIGVGEWYHEWVRPTHNAYDLDE